MAFGGRRENASRSSSIQESGFSFLNLCKGSQIQGIGALHFLISSVQRNGIPSSQTMFALFYSQFGDRGAFSPWGKLFAIPPWFTIFSVQKIPPRRIETSCVAPFYSRFGDRGAFSPWGKLFGDSPRVHPWGHSLLFALLQTQHLIWICVLAISYWLSKKLTISNGGWFEI